MPRISVVGTSCSGKTTLARRIAAQHHIPHIELDAIYWLPQWTAQPIERFRSAVEAAAAEDAWVIDGNYSKVRDIVWGRATDVVWLNFPFHVVLWRAIRRTARRIVTQEELFAGNRETFRKTFLDRESILWWVIRTHHRRMRTYSGLLGGGRSYDFALHQIRGSRDETALLKRLGAAD